MDNNTFTIEIDNIEYTYQIVKILNKTGLNHDYIIYKDNDGTYASRYKIINNKIELENVENDNEWKYINKMIKGEINEL